jgi:isopenicillin-N N-acyltransferase-like protein
VSLPVVEVAGAPYAQGAQHGAALRAAIEHNIALYYGRLASEAQLPPAAARQRAGELLDGLGEHPYRAALDGLADSTRLPLVDLAVLNFRYELLYYQYGVVGLGTDGCSAFAVLPGGAADDHLWLGQNWDWIPDVACAMLRCREPNGDEILSFTEAGIVGGKIGLNSHGLGLTINGLLTTADDWARPGRPFHVRCYDVLRCRSLAAARQIVADAPRACAANFLLAQAPATAVNIEAAPDALCASQPAAHRLAHTNHFRDPLALGVVEPETERRPHTQWRLSRLEALLDQPGRRSRADLLTILRDHQHYPDSICRHTHPADPPDEWCVTVASVLMDLASRELWVSDGSPCTAPYVELALAQAGPAPD